MSDYVTEKVREFAGSLLPAMDLELVEVQFRQEGEGWVLRIFIDGPDGVGVDHCARVSRELSDFLDVEELISHAYQLEVSSPGLERRLNDLADFTHYAGRKARIKVRQPIDEQKVFLGLIDEVDEEGVTLLLEDGSRCRIEMDQIRKARLSL